MEKLTDKSYRTRVEAIICFLRGITSEYIEAGRRWCALIDEDVFVKQRVLVDFPSIRVDTWLGLEKVGRGEILPDLLFQPSRRPGWKMTMTLPLDIQKLLVDNPKVSVWTPDGEKLVSLNSITPAQVRLIHNTAEHKLRSIEEQAALLPVKAGQSCVDIVGSNERKRDLIARRSSFLKWITSRNPADFKAAELQKLSPGAAMKLDSLAKEWLEACI